MGACFLLLHTFTSFLESDSQILMPALEAIPPIGGVTIADYLLNHRRYADFSKAQFISVNWIAILSVALGIAAGHSILGIVSVNAVLGGVFSYILLNPLFNRSLVQSTEVSHAD